MMSSLCVRLQAASVCVFLCFFGFSILAFKVSECHVKRLVPRLDSNGLHRDTFLGCEKSLAAQPSIAHIFIDNREALYESTRGANCTRRLFRYTLLHCKGPGKIQTFLRQNSWREIDQSGKSVLHQAG